MQPALTTIVFIVDITLGVLIFGQEVTMAAADVEELHSHDKALAPEVCVCLFRRTYAKFSWTATGGVSEPGRRSSRPLINGKQTQGAASDSPDPNHGASQRSVLISTHPLRSSSDSSTKEQHFGRSFRTL
jgi:hypothetical protein